jgi:hypothetical protein
MFVMAVGRLTDDGADLLGTAFSLPSRHLFATALHVSGFSDNNLVIVGRNTELEYQDTSDPSVMYFRAEIAAADPARDLCILRTDMDEVPGLAIASTDVVKIGEEIEIAGYPHADTGRFVLTHQFTEVGAKILIDAGGVKSKHVVLNIQARPGQSGSPIIEVKRGVVVAVLIGSYAPGGGGGISLDGIDPSTLHQTTHAVSAHYLEEMMRSVR